jgi:hypothetical protein
MPIKSNRKVALRNCFINECRVSLANDQVQPNLPDRPEV